MLEGLLRGDPLTRSSFYTRALDAGWMTVNEVRKAENLNPLPDLLESGVAIVDTWGADELAKLMVGTDRLIGTTRRPRRHINPPLTIYQSPLSFILISEL